MGGRISGARGRRGEQWIEEESGGALRRTRNRPRYVRAPDFDPWRHPDTGDVFQVESKYGEKAEPKKVRAALDQAASYAEGTIPIAVFRNLGASDGIACLPVSALLRLLGISAKRFNAQLLLLGRSEP